MEEQPTKLNFTEWSLDTWNQMLYRHFFTVLPGKSIDQVVRLYVTADELCAAANVRSRDIRSAFIHAMRRAIGAHSIGLDAHRRSRTWDRESAVPPPFLSHLLFTCMIANDLAEELKSVGDFRDRLSACLPGKSSHSLHQLRPLWEEFAAWLTRRNIQDPHCRRLLLPHIPDSGYHSIIGYSVRLAVPSRRDQKTLITLLRRHKLVGSEPEINAILRIVGENLAKFSRQFQEVFHEFASDLKKSPASVVFHMTFWMAVREVAFSCPLEAERAEEGWKTRLELEDDDGRFWLSVTSDRETHFPEIKSVVLANQRRSPFRFLLVSELDGTGLASNAFSFKKAGIQVETLLAGTRDAISTGFLLFKESDDDVYVLSSDFPSTGNLRALVSDRQILDFTRAVHERGLKLEVTNSVYEGWWELRGLTVDILRRLNLSRFPSLLSMRCLRPTLPPPEIRIRGGVRIGDSFVAIPHVMPLVEVPDAGSVMLELAPGNWSSLERISGGENRWFLNSDVQPQLLLGSHRIVAFVGNLPIAEKTITFVEGTYGYEYKGPLDTPRWFVESALCDNASFSEGADAIANRERLPNVGLILKTVVDYAKSPACPEAEERIAHDLTTVLSCQFAVKRGMAESSLVSMLTLYFGLPLSRVWPILRAWVEAGILDVLGDYRWRGRMYFARVPRLVVFRRGPLYEAVLTGLVPPFLRERFNALVEMYRLSFVDGKSCCAAVPSLPRCRSISLDLLVALAKELNLPPLASLRVPDEVGTSIRSVLERKSTEPQNWPAYRWWDWKRRIFTETPAEPTHEGITIRWCRRDDGPDCYKLYQDDSIMWWSRSRIWAVLGAFTLAGLEIFKCKANGVLESWGDSLYIPLPLARLAAVISIEAPGPIESPDKRMTYRYAFPDDGARDTFLNVLWPRDQRQKKSYNLSTILAAISKSGTGPLVPIPLALRHAFDKFPGNSQIQTLGLVPASTLSQLYAVVRSTINGDD